MDALDLSRRSPKCVDGALRRRGAEASRGGRLVAALLWAGLSLWPPLALAQSEPSGALTFPLTWAHSEHGRDVLGIGVRAMAVDRVPDTVVGRFGELRAGVGVGVDGEMMSWELGGKLGVGVATDYFVLFAASGQFVDAYPSIDDASAAEDVPTGVGTPVAVGLWLTPFDALYVYAMAEARWVYYVESREVTSFSPFGVGEEFLLRGGAGFEIDELELRVDYVYHQVGPAPWHIVSLELGPRPETPP